MVNTQPSQRDSPRKTTALIFYQKGVGGSRFRCLIVMQRIDIYTSKRLSFRATCLESVFVGQDLHILMEENGFPIRLFGHALASNTVTHVPFNVWHRFLLCCEQSQGNLILSESRCFASENHSSNPHFHCCFLAPSGLRWLLALPQWHLSSRCKNMRVDDLDGMPGGPHMNRIRGLWIGGCLWDNDVIFWSCVCVAPHTTDKASITRSQQIRMPWRVFASVFCSHRVCL